MSRKTQTYRLEYFRQGSDYSAASDRRRFLTLDYNLQSYVGIVGVGIIQGWDTEEIDNLKIQILQGTGFINGYFCESPYSIKLRSEMISGDREIEELKEYNTVYDELTISERNVYVNAIKEYNPDFNPVGPIENCPVKVVVPFEINLFDNTDNYIYARIPYGIDSYPNLLDYPSPPGSDYPPLPLIPPVRADYSNYDTYKVAYDAYMAQIQSIRDYDWREDSGNHFTQVEFINSSVSLIDSNVVLLGKIVTRFGQVSKIDKSNIVILADLYTLIKDNAQKLLVSHNHGGNKSHDPPKIRLETEFLDTSLRSFNPETNRAVYMVFGNAETSINRGHKHTYVLDDKGNGYTFKQIGSGVGAPENSHFHRILEFEVQNYNETEIGLVAEHSHIIDIVKEKGIYGDAGSKWPKTSVTMGHSHEYRKDDGQGITLRQLGYSNVVPAPKQGEYGHVHYIKNNIIGQSESPAAYKPIPSHTHDFLPPDHPDISKIKSKDWGRFDIYVNDEYFGDETSSNIVLNSDDNTLSINGGVNAVLRKYSCSFEVVLHDARDFGARIDKQAYEYRFEGRYYSLLRFMIAMQMDYNLEFGDFYHPKMWDRETGLEVFDTEAGDAHLEGGTLEEQSARAASGMGAASNAWAIMENFESHPFFIMENGFSEGLVPLRNQSGIGQELMREVGDTFTFIPPAARNIIVVLEEEALAVNDKVEVEILGSAEVSGELKPENILFVNANKILSGEFIAEVIPFVSHIGRLQEKCLPVQYSLYSNDGWRYQVVPTITDVSSGHSHRLIINDKTIGATTQVLIGNRVSYYAEDLTGNQHFVYHNHGVSGTVLPSDRKGVLEWQSALTGQQVQTSHTHNIVYPVIGNNKTVYSIKEDAHGNVYCGTSDGVMIVPSQSAYLIIINGIELYFYGNDLWILLQKAKSRYEIKTKDNLEITRKLYGEQFDEKIVNLVNDGDQIYMTAISSPVRDPDKITIRKISSFHVPDLKYVAERELGQILNNETIIGYKVVDKETGEQRYIDSESEMKTGEEISLYVVEREFNEIPMWSMEIDTSETQANISGYVYSESYANLFLVGSNIVAKSIGSEQDPYREWKLPVTPFTSSILRKIIKDTNENYWIATNNGIIVSRSYNQGMMFGLVNHPSFVDDIEDIAEGEWGSIYCVSKDGLFKTQDGGKIWNKKHSALYGFKQVFKDKTMDKTNVVNDHYHMMDVNSDGDGFLTESIGTGVEHIHKVEKWDIKETLGHYHTLVSVIYVVDSYGYIFKSDDNGESWTDFGYVLGSDRSGLFAAFGFLYYGDKNGLYRSSNGENWTKILDEKVYSFEWNYDNNGIFMGGNNVVFETLDGTNIGKVYDFEGNPNCVMVENNVVKYFNYAYSNFSQTFCFRNFNIGNSSLQALVDFTKWIPEAGGWSSSYLYDVCVNYRKVYSTKSNWDRRLLYGYNFNVFPEDGIIDFSASANVIQDIAVNDILVRVDNTSSFAAGETVLISSDSDQTYARISSIGNGFFILNASFTKIFAIGSKVSKIPNLNGSSSVLVNIYNSLLSNIGKFTHYDLEDKLSLHSDFRPFQFNDTYLSNLLQLTQGVRYVYPDINSSFKNSVFYDFRYSMDPLDPYYINKYIDVLTSEAYQNPLYASVFSAMGAKKINRILIGYGNFAGRIIVATDIGIFWAPIEHLFEGNWFYAVNFKNVVNDIVIHDDKLYLATLKGLYYTEDLDEFFKVKTLGVNYPLYSFGLRWTPGGSVVTDPHEATFISDDDTGIIVASSGTPYVDFEPSRGIKITGAGDKNGNYVVLEVLDHVPSVSSSSETYSSSSSSSLSSDVSTYGMAIRVTPVFEGDDGVRDDVVITMASWWGQWEDGINVSNPDLTNTLLLGGDSRISFNDGGETESWVESQYARNISDFISRRFLPLTNGKILLPVTGKGNTNYLLYATDIGRNWQNMKSFNTVNGTINNFRITNFGNIELTVNYNPEHVANPNSLEHHDITLFSSGGVVFKGKIICNENNSIVIFVDENINIPENLKNGSFSISPKKINVAAETDSGLVLFGTDMGIYHDDNTIVNKSFVDGIVENVGVNATIERIDVSGTIVSVERNVVNQNTVLFVKADDVIRKGEHVGKTMYILDSSPMEQYKIIANDSVNAEGECRIELEDKDEINSFYVGKRFRIIGETSRIYVKFDVLVQKDQFNNGKFGLQTNGSNVFYDIKTNNDSYIDLNIKISPDDLNNKLTVGKDIRVIDSGGKLPLWVYLDGEITENSLNGMELKIERNNILLDEKFTVYKNFENLLQLDASDNNDYYVIGNGDRFIITGKRFENLDSFNNLVTSVQSGHWHSTNLIKGNITGIIGSFGNIDSSYVNINVIDTVNFNIPIVQLRNDLLYGAKIVFYNSNNNRVNYVSEVASHDLSSIKVRIKNSDNWNFNEEDFWKISDGWRWKIFAYNYGYTDDITYDDFVFASYGVLEDVNARTNLIVVEDTSGLSVGDKISIQDDTLSIEYNYIDAIVNGTTIRTRSLVGRSYYSNRNSQMKVLRDNFSNTHIHQIRNGEVEKILVSEYLDRGYPSHHSHRVHSLISNVNVLLYGEMLSAAGSGNIVYESSDDGETWTSLVVLNDYLEGYPEEVEEVSEMILNNGKFIVGANNGNLFIQK